MTKASFSHIQIYFKSNISQDHEKYWTKSLPRYSYKKHVMAMLICSLYVIPTIYYTCTHGAKLLPSNKQRTSFFEQAIHWQREWFLLVSDKGHYGNLAWHGKLLNWGLPIPDRYISSTFILYFSELQPHTPIYF